jgi:hypothetical protein
MQISTDSKVKASSTKATGKSRARTKPAPPETLHLKSKNLIATPASDITSMVATAAYYCAEQRGFKPGHELEDWLRAEQQVRSLLS